MRVLMRIAVFLSTVALILLSSTVGAQELAKAWELLGKGDREEAGAIAGAALANARSQKERGEVVLLQALCEENGRKAVEQLNRFLSGYPGHPLRWRAEMELGLHYYALGTYRGAAKHFENARSLRPPKKEQVRAGYWLGLALEGAGDAGRAGQQFEVVRKDDAGTGLAELASLGLADCLRAQGNFNGALSEYTRFAATYRGSNWLPCALYGAGICLDELGRKADATTYYARLKKDYPGSFEAALVRDRVKVPSTEATRSAGAKNFTLQIGAFSQESNANALVGLLRDEGVVDAKIVQEERGGRKLFIVGLEGFPTREAALKRGKELSTRFGLSYSIVAR